MLSLLKKQGQRFAVVCQIDMFRCRATSTSLVILICISSLHTSVRPHLTYLSLYCFSLLTAYRKVLMLECFQFFHTSCIMMGE